MDNSTNSKSQYTSTLADINSSRINIPRTQLASKTRPAPVASITSGNQTNVNNTVIQKKYPQKGVSPHPSQLLRWYSVNMESNRSKILPPSSKSSDPRSTRPCTPSEMNYSIPAQHTSAVVDTVVGTDTNPFTPTSRKTSSPPDKELPPKPVLREHDSPERRGIFDATDSASKFLNTSYPPLQPTQTGGDSPSDIGSFKTTPSLYSAQENAPLDVEFGTAVAKTALRASASALDFHSPFPSKDGSLEEQIVRPLSVNSSKSANYSISAPRISERRAASFGHVASQKNGSPIHRKQVSAKVNRHEFRGYEALSTTGQRRIAKASLARVEDTLYQPPKQVVKYGRPSSSNAYQKGFTTELPDTEPNNGDRRVNYESRALSHDDSSRRSIKYGFGATVRFSNDAREVIMGGSIPKLPRASHKSSVSIEVPRPGTTSQTIPKVNVQPATPITNRGKAQNRESFGVWSKSVQDGIPQEGGVALLRRVSKQAEREQFYRTRQEAKKVYREAGITPTVAAFPPRSSSLSNSPTSIHSSKTPKQKASGPIVPQPFVNHMARPTAASAAREAQAKTSLLQRGKNTLKKKTPESTNKYVSTKPTSSSTAGCLAQSGSMTSVKRSSKGFKSRFSSILPGRRPSRHSSDQVQNTGLKRASITIISSKSTTDNKTAAFYQQKHNVSPNLTTFEDSGMDLSPSDIIRTYPGGNIYYDPSDKLAPELEEQDSQAAEIIASEVHAVSNGARQRVHPAQSQGFSRLPRDDEDPPTSPLTRDGPGGHYAEYENQDDTDPFDETGVSRYLDEQLSDAQNSLNRAIQAGQEIQSQELRDMISNVVQLAGNAIQVSREARIANIALNNSVVGLVRQTSQLTTAATSASVRAAGAAQSSA